MKSDLQSDEKICINAKVNVKTEVKTDGRNDSDDETVS